MQCHPSQDSLNDWNTGKACCVRLAVELAKANGSEDGIRSRMLLYEYESNVEKKKKKRYRVLLKSITLNEKYEIKNIIIVLKCKKMFSLRNLTKISNLICVDVRQVTFLSENWKKLSVWSNVFFSISALEMKGKHIKSRRNQTYLSFTALEHYRFMQISHNASWLFANT